MPENKSLPLVETATSEDVAVSPAVVEIMERAHKWADDVLERFKREHMGVVLPLLSDFNAYIGYMLGTRKANPEDFSQIIAFKEALRKQEAANDAKIDIAA